MSNDPFGDPGVTGKGPAESYFSMQGLMINIRCFVRDYKASNIYFSLFNFIQPLKKCLYIFSCGC